MEKELNIAAILKEKPKNTKLWSATFGYVYLLESNSDYFDVKDTPHNLSWRYSSNGSLKDYKGVLSIYPSHDMRDWSKFTWKKGDVLRFSDILVVFEKWTKDDYTEFKASYEYNCHSDSFDKGNVYYTSEFCKAIDEVANNFIKKIEEHYGGKLNLSTLEIEQPKQEFKDGDIVEFGESVAICKKFEEDKLYFYACIDAVCGLFLSDSVETSSEYRLATDSEKQQLFSALEKENKRWNPDTKQIEDLSKKCELKPLDYFLAKFNGDDRAVWYLHQYSFERKGILFYVNEGCMQSDKYTIIPYNDSTKHLLGTTDEWKGGEG